jgi:hypothetical protein
MAGANNNLGASRSAGADNNLSASGSASANHPFLTAYPGNPRDNLKMLEIRCGSTDFDFFCFKLQISIKTGSLKCSNK